MELKIIIIKISDLDLGNTRHSFLLSASFKEPPFVLFLIVNERFGFGTFVETKEVT